MLRSANGIRRAVPFSRGSRSQAIKNASHHACVYVCVPQRVLKKVGAKLNKRSVRDTQRKQQDAAECHSHRSGHADRHGHKHTQPHNKNTHTKQTHTYIQQTHRDSYTLGAKEIFVCKLRMIAQVFLHLHWQTRLHFEWPPVLLLAHTVFLHAASSS